MITLAQAKAMRKGDCVVDSRGRTWRATSDAKVWKRDPSRVLVNLKFGLYSYSAIDQYDLNLVSFPSK